jgi:recombinational DNA repair ATPase RecF
LIQYRKAFIDRLLAGGEEAAEKTAADYQREAAEKDRWVKTEKLKTEKLK